MPPIVLRYPDMTTKTFYAVDEELGRVLTDCLAIRPDGSYYIATPFQGGVLLDGCPLNRVLYGTYSGGQKEALDAAGIACALDVEAPAPPPPPTPPPPPLPPPVPAPNSDELIPFVQASPIVLVPTGEPTSTVVATVVASVISAIIGVFGRGLPGKVAKEIFGLRDAVVQLGREIVRLTQFLARGIQAVLEALKTVYNKVIKRALDKIEAINTRISKIIDKVLLPYLQLLQRIRQLILDIYRQIFAPIIEAIQTVRKAIALLRILHVPGMQKLDEKLQKIQAKLIGVITALLRRTNDHSGLLNKLMTLRNTLQHGLLLGSLHERRKSFINLWWDEQTAALDPGDEEAIAAVKAQAVATPQQDALEQLLSLGDAVLPGTPGPNETALNDLLMRGTQ